MKISLFGLGYVGSVAAACAAGEEVRFLCVDIDEMKVARFNAGQSSISEPGLDRLLREKVDAGYMSATTDVDAAVQASSISMICVGTPVSAQGEPDLTAVYSVARSIGTALQGKDGFHAVVCRSTVPPGTVDRIAAIVEETSGKKRGVGFGVASNPEFLREGSAIKDYMNPPFTVIGAEDDRTRDSILAIYADLDGEKVVVSLKEAELLKYVCNAYHALKVTFANEVGSIARNLGVDGRTVMELFCMDTQLNISTAYFRPGAPYGGSCLPKDTRALSGLAVKNKVDAPVVGSIESSNRAHIEKVVNEVSAAGIRDIGLMGVTFKRGTDDLRDSPFAHIAAALVSKGFRVTIYDPDIRIDLLTGANQSFIEKVMPGFSDHIEEDLSRFMESSQALVIAKPVHGVEEAISRWEGTFVYDCSGIDDIPDAPGRTVQGLCW